MPTLEELEQRVVELERTLPALRREQIDIRPIEERLNTLRQELAEQQRQMLIDRNATNSLLHTQDKILAEMRNFNARFDRIESEQRLIIQILNDRFAKIEQMINERLPKKEE
jgi:hypothetical protein